MALTAYLKATYEDGFVLVEDERDQSLYVPGANMFSDVLNSRPCEEHGPLVELCLITPDETHTIDWTTLPANARPIRFKNMELQLANGSLGDPYITSINFGVQWNDEDGTNHQEVIEVR